MQTRLLYAYTVPYILKCHDETLRKTFRHESVQNESATTGTSTLDSIFECATAEPQLSSSATAATAAAGAHIASRSCVAHVWRLMCAVRIEIAGQFHDYYMVCVQYVRCATVRLCGLRLPFAIMCEMRPHGDYVLHGYTTIYTHTHTRFVLYISF